MAGKGKRVVVTKKMALKSRLKVAEAAEAFIDSGGGFGVNSMSKALAQLEKAVDNILYEEKTPYQGESEKKSKKRGKKK